MLFRIFLLLISLIALGNAAAVPVTTTITVDGCPAEEPTPPPSPPVGSLVGVNLVPAVHESIDLSNPVNLQINVSVSLFYADPAPVDTETAIAFVNIPQLAYPAVVLDHTDSISDLSCTDTSLVIKFTNNVAFQTAAASWTTQIVLISSSLACTNTADPSHRTYVLVNGLNFSPSDLSVRVSVSYIEFADAVGGTSVVTIDVGTFIASDSSSSPGFNVQGGPTNASSISSGGNPAADFDVVLDQTIGFLDVQDPTYWAQLYPGITGETAADFAGELVGTPLNISPERRRSLNSRTSEHSFEKRGWFDSVVNFVSSAANKVADTAKSVANTVANAAASAAAAAAEAAAKAFDALNRAVSGTYTPINQNINIATPKGTDNTPWGPGTQVFSKTVTKSNTASLFSNTNSFKTGTVTIYCVGCGVTGTINVKGTITFTLTGGISAGSITASGPMSATVKLGLVSSAQSVWDYVKQIAAVPLSPFTIPGVLTIGPQISLSAGGTLTVTALGQLLAGVTLTWPSIFASIDLSNLGRSSASGFQPNVVPAFQVSGSITATAELYLLLALDFGIDICNGKVKKTISLVEKPDVYLTASISGQLSLTDSQLSGSVGDANCPGAQLVFGFKNFVYAEIPGLSQIPINTYNGPSISKCLKIPTRRDLTGTEISGALDHAIEHRTAMLSPRFGSAPVLNYTVMNSEDGALVLHYADNGNIYALSDNTTTANGLDASMLFADTESGIVGDSEGRLFHGYVDTLKSLGVSRFRLSDGSHIPKTAVMLELVPVDIGDGFTALMASDTAGTFYYPILCVYKDLYPKIFIATDSENSLAVLTDPANIAKLTGATVSSCGFVAFTSGPLVDTEGDDASSLLPSASTSASAPSVTSAGLSSTSTSAAPSSSTFVLTT